MSSPLPSSRQGWLNQLGLIGFAGTEHVLLAGLVSDGPLLLTGGIGCKGKPTCM
jgi:hypothetical protein